MSKWDKYKVLLTDEHKKKLEPLWVEHQKKKLIYNKLYDRVDDMKNDIIKKDEFKELQKMKTDTDYELTLYRKAYNELYIKYYPEYNDITEKYSASLRELTTISNKIDKFKSAVYILYDLPEPKVTPTDEEAKQCTICTENIKDHALPCGHVYCIACIGKMKCECPNCKKRFVKDKCIKLFY